MDGAASSAAAGEIFKFITQYFAVSLAATAKKI
jgi:hypothetical protein